MRSYTAAGAGNLIAQLELRNPSHSAQGRWELWDTSGNTKLGSCIGVSIGQIPVPRQAGALVFYEWRLTVTTVDQQPADALETLLEAGVPLAATDDVTNTALGPAPLPILSNAAHNNLVASQFCVQW